MQIHPKGFFKSASIKNILKDGKIKSDVLNIISEL